MSTLSLRDDGPKGRNAVIESSWDPPRFTKDGVTGQAVELKDKFQNIGAKLVTWTWPTRPTGVAGDGTTTATVLARPLLHGMDNVTHGANPWRSGGLPRALTLFVSTWPCKPVHNAGGDLPGGHNIR